MKRTVCTFILLSLLFLPFVQKYAEFPIKDYELNGYAESTKAAKFTWQSFFNSSFQSNITAYLQENIGYKGYLIALKNQVDYSIFHKLNYGIDLGDDGQLFYWNHIDVHCGHLSLSEDSFQKKGSECLALTNMLDSLHIHSVFVLAPGKPWYYEDKLPKRFKDNCSVDNDYHHVLDILHSKSIPLIDLNLWFKSMRYNCAHPLFPRLGTHWSYYGACVAIDTLSRYIEGTLGVDLADYSINSDSLSDQPYKTDKDLWALLNVLLPMQSDSLSYPKISFKKNNKRKPKVLFIGDSFNWNLVETKIPSELFSENSRFWFYKHQLYDLNGKWLSETPEEVNLYELLKGTDMVIFLSTEVLHHRMDFGFANAVMADKSLQPRLTQAK